MMSKPSEFISNGHSTSYDLDGILTHQSVYGYFLDIVKEYRKVIHYNTKKKVLLEIEITLKLQKALLMDEIKYTVDRNNAEFGVSSSKTYNRAPKKYEKQFEQLLEFYGEVFND